MNIFNNNKYTAIGKGGKELQSNQDEGPKKVNV